MRSFISWIRPPGGWIRSPFGDLPMLRADDASAHQTWLILAGGIALILSRASQAELESRFAAARQVHAIAHARLQQKRLPKPEVNLLRSALSEIANLADPMTREAGRECLARCVERLAARARSTAPAPLAAAAGAAAADACSPGSTEVQSTQAASTQAAGSDAPDEHEATQLDLDLLFERSNRLRGTVAWARSTTVGQDG